MFPRLLLPAFLLTFSIASWSQSEIRLVGRILSVSDSKKTVLFNRGSEDGLKLDDHAKLSLPEGILARGLLVRVSPGRSVWSLYKFYKKEKVMENVIVTLKTTPPLKLTQDASKNLDLLAPDLRSRQEQASKKLNVIKMKKDKKIITQFDKVDYRVLDDAGKTRKLDPAVDWSNLRNLQKPREHDPKVDFSNLH